MTVLHENFAVQVVEGEDGEKIFLLNPEIRAAIQARGQTSAKTKIHEPKHPGDRKAMGFPSR